MKLFYASSISYPSQYANRIQTLSTSNALAKELGDNFILGAHDVKSNTIYQGKVVNFSAERSFILAWQQLLYCKKENVTEIYSREHPLLFALMVYNKLFFRMKLSFIYEAHDVHSFLFGVTRFAYVVKHSDYIFCTGEHTQRVLVSYNPKLRSSVVPNGVDLNEFAATAHVKNMRVVLGISSEQKIILYLGSIGLYDWKGTDVFIGHKNILKIRIQFFM